jgi:lipopolysaccharide/colanic/teichoic acid biosynthesis glycosyltransferase
MSGGMQMAQQQRTDWNRGRQLAARGVLARLARRLALRGHEGAKRALDLAAGMVAALASLPLFALLATLIKLEDGGPVLYWQTRVGRHGRHFRFPKFRSMAIDAEARLAQLRAKNQHGAGITFKLRQDPRVTRVGRLLRRLSLDELPQLWCVLRGEMTLVGPRPALPVEVARYSLADRRRLDVTPGLTCLWQIGGRSDIAFPQQCEMDLDYIRRRDLWLDLKILVKTIPAVVSGKGAY